MTATAAPAPTPSVEAFDFQRNGSTGAGFYTAIVNDQVDGEPGRFLVQFISADPQRSELTGIHEDPRDGKIAFVTNLDAAHAGDLSQGLRGHELTARWLPLLEQARQDKAAADDARREAENIARRARTLDTINDALPRMGLPVTEEYVEAARRVMLPGIPRLADNKLENFRISVQHQVDKARTAQA